MMYRGYEAVRNVLLHRTDLFVRGRKDGRGYAGYFTYDKDEDEYTYTSWVSPAAEKFVHRFKNAEKLEDKTYTKLRIKSLDFVEWFMDNIDYMYWDGGNYYFDNNKPIDDEEIDDDLEKENQVKWIRTKDRLPEVNTRVIVSTPGREISVGELLPSGEGGWMYLCEDCTKQADLLEVEAWMPLPEPYGEDEAYKSAKEEQYRPKSYIIPSNIGD